MGVRRAAADAYLSGWQDRTMRAVAERSCWSRTHGGVRRSNRRGVDRNRAADGLFHYDGTNFAQVATSHEGIVCLGNDDEGNVWAGTDGGGLNCLRPRVVELQAKESGLPSEALRSICEDHNGVMWAVGENGKMARRVANRWSDVAGKEEW